MPCSRQVWELVRQELSEALHSLSLASPRSHEPIAKRFQYQRIELKDLADPPRIENNARCTGDPHALILAQGRLRRRNSFQAVGQHDGVFECLTSSLPQIR